jgi:hypothetical protein
MSEGVMDVARENCIYMGCSASLQCTPSAAGIDRDVGMRRLPQRVMANKQAPGVWSPAGKKLERPFQIIQVDNAVRPVQPTLHAARSVDRGNPHKSTAQLDQLPYKIMTGHEAFVELERRHHPLVNVQGQVQRWRVVVTRNCETPDVKTVQPGPRRLKFPASPGLCDVARDNQRVGPLALDIRSNGIQGSFVRRSEMHVRNMHESQAFSVHEEWALFQRSCDYRVIAPFRNNDPQLSTMRAIALFSC